MIPNPMQSSNSGNFIKWRECRRHEFVDQFRIMLSEVRPEIFDHITIDVNVAVDSITRLYLNAATSIRKPKTFKASDSQPPWWDNDCDKSKQLKYSALRKFRYSGLLDDRIDYMTKKKSFKALCGAKKRSYQGKRRQELVDAGKNPSKFWHVIKKSTVAATTKSPATGNEWFTYFQSLLSTDVTHEHK